MTRGGDTISACLVVHNEERSIGAALESLSGVVDEILVVHDGPCEDGTLTLSAKYGARTFVRPRMGFCEAHLDFARRQASGAWLLLLDADEHVSPPLAASLRSLARDPAVDGYAFQWRTLYEGRQVRLGIDRVFHKACFLRKDKVTFDGRVHGRRTVAGRVRKVRHVIEHRPPGRFLDAAFFRAKVTAWSEANARAILAAGAARSPALHLVKAHVSFAAHFCRLYFFRLYLLSGLTGLKFSYLMALFNYRTNKNLYDALTRQVGAASPPDEAK